MDLEDIKNLIEEEGGKLIIANENGPSLVVMAYDDYRKIKNNNSQEFKGKSEKIIERLPIKESPINQTVKRDSFGIDDLPF